MSDAPLRDIVRADLPELVAIRHDLHRHPELGYEEERTSGVVQRELKAAGVAFRAGVARTGVVAHLPATERAWNTRCRQSGRRCLESGRRSGVRFHVELTTGY